MTTKWQSIRGMGPASISVVCLDPSPTQAPFILSGGSAAESVFATGAQRGFTLIEMLVVVVVLAVLLTLGVPSYQRLVVDSRMTTQSNEFLTMLHFVRSEAIKRNERVTMCKSTDSSSCATAGTWAQGWLIFADAVNPNATVGTIDVGDTILRVHGALGNASTLVGTTDVANLISYVSSGQPSQSGRFDLCASDAAFAGRDITVTVTGRPNVSNDGPPPTCS